jgi:multidrug efflux pump subunit AcrA (membrane-fusion protein)
VRQQGGHDIVLVMQNGKAERRAVTVSQTRSDEAVISAGVAAGEKVIVDGPVGLADGAAVAEKRGYP